LVLLQIASEEAQPEAISRAAGAAPAGLLSDRLVSEWDVRNLTDPAAETFFAWRSLTPQSHGL
jgi:hypothetical protein